MWRAIHLGFCCALRLSRAGSLELCECVCALGLTTVPVPSALCLLREPLQHVGGAGSPSLDCGRRAHHHSPLPSSQAQQAHCLRRVPQLRQVGDGAHGHHHEAQAGRRPVRGGVRGRVEEVQPGCGREDPEGRPGARDPVGARRAASAPVPG